MLDIAAVCLVATALLAYLNHRFIGLPPTIGVMGIALLVSLALVGLDAVGAHTLRDYEQYWLQGIDFSDVLMQGMLSFLLFAGALHVDLSELRRFRWQIGLLAIGGTALSAVCIGLGMSHLMPLFGVQLPIAYCLLFGALISPTDPVAVLGILKSAGAPKSVETVISGESLFNDGVGVVLFAAAFSLLDNPAALDLKHAGLLLLREAGGGLVFGSVLGWVTFYMLCSIDSYQEEILITLAMVMGGYALAAHLHISGPLAMVVAGLIIGNQGRQLAMSQTTREHLDTFWELIDAVLNSVLFVLIGLEVIMLKFGAHLWLPAAVVVAMTLVARWITVAIPLVTFRKTFGLPRGSWKVLTWGGLRGGISVALALSLPPGPDRDLVLSLTYVVVVFSILVQGLTIARTVPKSPL